MHDVTLGDPFQTTTSTEPRNEYTGQQTSTLQLSSAAAKIMVNCAKPPPDSNSTPISPNPTEEKGEKTTLSPDRSKIFYPQSTTLTL